jgi:signal transduction histidine kinase
MKLPSEENSRPKSWWPDLPRMRRSGVPVREERETIAALQWLVAIAISYLVFAVQDWNLTDPGAGLLIIVCLLSGVTLQRIPERILDKGYIQPGLLILDSLLIVSAILLRPQTPWDLLLLFFFCVFIAAVSENILQVGIASALLSIVFVLFMSPDAKAASAISPDLLVRVPFMFGISIFYGYMSHQLKQKKKRIARIEETVRLKRQLISALAHDIKTPLNVILGYTELLAGEYGGQPDAAERSAYLKHVRENSARIVRLITDFLAVSKLETLGVETTRTYVRMNAIAEDVADQQMVTARDKGLTLTLDLDKDLAPVIGDSNQLQRALWNLVGNAIKFTPAGGAVVIKTGMINERVAIAVEDTGPGIPSEDIPRLFREFRRLEGSGNTKGTGLGLFIVKTIVDAHDGCVSVESREGAGTKFTILLPASKDHSVPIHRDVLNKRVDEDLYGPHRVGAKLGTECQGGRSLR